MSRPYESGQSGTDRDDPVLVTRPPAMTRKKVAVAVRHANRCRARPPRPLPRPSAAIPIAGAPLTGRFLAFACGVPLTNVSPSPTGSRGGPVRAAPGRLGTKRERVPDEGVDDTLVV